MVVMGTCSLRCRVGPELRVSTQTVITFHLVIVLMRSVWRCKGFELNLKDNALTEAIKLIFVS